MTQVYLLSTPFLAQIYPNTPIPLPAELAAVIPNPTWSNVSNAYVWLNRTDQLNTGYLHLFNPAATNVDYSSGQFQQILGTLPASTITLMVVTNVQPEHVASIKDLESRGVQIYNSPQDQGSIHLLRLAHNSAPITPTVGTQPAVNTIPEPAPPSVPVSTVGPESTSYLINNPILKTEKNKQHSQEWKITESEHQRLQQIITFVNKLLRGLPGAPNDEIGLLFDKQYHGYWLSGFIRQTYDPNPRHNMEVWEKYGDAVMKLFFIQMLVQLYPQLTHSDISDLVENSLEAGAQSDISKTFKFNELVLTPLTTDNVKLAEDTLESFFGVLYEVAGLVRKQHSKRNFAWTGDDYMRQLTEVFYRALLEKTLIPQQEQLGSGFKNNPTNQVKEIFQKFGYGDIINTLVHKTGQHSNIKLTLRIPPDIYHNMSTVYIPQDKLDAVGPDAATPILSEVDKLPNESMKLLKRRAFEDARAKLAQWGITIQTVSKIQFERTKEFLQREGLWERFQILLRNEGYDPEFFKYQRTETYIDNQRYLLWQLVSQRANTHGDTQNLKILIGRLYKDNNSYTADLVRRYTDQGERGTDARPT